MVIVWFNLLQADFSKTHSPQSSPKKGSYQFSETHFQGANPYNSVSLMKTDKHWELHPSQVVIETKLGHGAFGDVFQGRLKGGVGTLNFESHTTSVAVKLLKSEFI